MPRLMGNACWNAKDVQLHVKSALQFREGSVECAQIGADRRARAATFFDVDFLGDSKRRLGCFRGARPHVTKSPCAKIFVAKAGARLSPIIFRKKSSPTTFSLVASSKVFTPRPAHSVRILSWHLSQSILRSGRGSTGVPNLPAPTVRSPQMATTRNRKKWLDP